MNKTQFMDFLHELSDVFDNAVDTGKLTRSQHKEIIAITQATFHNVQSLNYTNCREQASELAKQLKQSELFWNLLGDVFKKHKVTT